MCAGLRNLATVAAALLLLTGAATAQPAFTEVSSLTDPLWITDENSDFWINAVAPADVDGDGDLDLAVLGFYVVYFGEVTDLLVIFENQGPDASGRWLFGEETVPLGTLWAGASDLAWGDYDNDGDPDLVVGSEGAMALYRNEEAVQRYEKVLALKPDHAQTLAGFAQP